MQERILESVRDHAFTVVKSGHGVGKTHITAATVLWWLFSFYPSKVVTTAPTWTQVENVLWKEIGGLYNKAKLPLGGRLKKVGLDLETEDWFAIGLSTDEAERFQGFHSPNLLVVFDEAPGVNPIIWEAAQGLMTGEHNHFLGIGNPISPSGPFFDAFKSSLYNKIQISCLDNPNYKEGREVIPGLTTKRWVDDRKAEWGEHSPLFMSRVLGEFPIEGSNNLIPLSWCEEAYNRRVEHVENHKYMGVDVARYGNNWTVITIYQKPIVRQWRLMGKNTMEVANFVLSLFNDERPQSVTVDDTGVGGGVVDRLLELRVPTVGVNFSESANRRGTFRGIRDEIYWNLRDLFRVGDIKLDRGRHENLVNQLSALQYTIMDRSGKIQVESKKELTKRGLVSPDDADSLALAVYGHQKLFRMAGMPTRAQVYRPEMEVTSEYY
jgi:phage terminase large subunit